MLWTVNIVSHNPAQSCSDILIIFPLNLQTINITRMCLAEGRGEEEGGKRSNFVPLKHAMSTGMTTATHLFMSKARTVPSSDEEMMTLPD